MKLTGSPEALAAFDSFMKGCQDESRLGRSPTMAGSAAGKWGAALLVASAALVSTGASAELTAQDAVGGINTAQQGIYDVGNATSTVQSIQNASRSHNAIGILSGAASLIGLGGRYAAKVLPQTDASGRPQYVGGGSYPSLRTPPPLHSYPGSARAAPQPTHHADDELHRLDDLGPR